jgi:hypothetical protein
MTKTILLLLAALTGCASHSDLTYHRESERIAPVLVIVGARGVPFPLAVEPTRPKYSRCPDDAAYRVRPNGC